jgi:hypothetical protein
MSRFFTNIGISQTLRHDHLLHDFGFVIYHQ